jgi:hypothetical protein
LTGGGLRHLRLADGEVIGAQHRKMVRGKWGLIPDYFRLRDCLHGVLGEAERILILVADVAAGDDTRLAAGLRNIDFEGERRELKLKRGFAKLWRLP